MTGSLRLHDDKPHRQLGKTDFRFLFAKVLRACVYAAPHPAHGMRTQKL
jgi:hypothetical protein